MGQRHYLTPHKNSFRSVERSARKRGEDKNQLQRAANPIQIGFIPMNIVGSKVFIPEDRLVILLWEHSRYKRKP